MSDMSSGFTGSPIPSTAPSHGGTAAPGEAPMVETPTLALGGTTRWQRFPSTSSLWGCLFVLVAAGAFLRFWRLGYQCYWSDEAATISKIHGTFDYMLSRLVDQGFPPGWYAILRWWCLRIEAWTGSAAVAFSPASTRALAALFGTFTVPALYFLARQFTDRKGSLLVALLAAVNPFLIYYSRDIKMYPAMWFFLVLNMAIFFRWQTTRHHLLWLPLFALTGAAMTAMQSLAWFGVGLQLLFLLTRPRLRSWDGPLWLAGVGVSSLLPIYWYFHRTAWINRVVDTGRGNGLDWITRYTDMSWKTFVSLPTAHLLGYLWPVYPANAALTRANHVMYAASHPLHAAYPPNADNADWARLKDWFELGGLDFNKHLATRSWPWMVDLQLAAAIGLFAILFLGLFPWRGIRRSAERDASVTHHRWWWVAIWLLLPPILFALTWIPDSSPWHALIWHKLDPRPFWEPRYLGIILPAMILWLAAALRRLPTWPLRTLAIVAVASISVFSALSNQLMFRNPPFNKSADIAMRYYDPVEKEALAIGDPAVAYPMEVEEVTYALAAHVRPFDNEHPFMPFDQLRRGLYSPSESIGFLLEMKNRPKVKTIVLTDRYGDISDPKDALSDASLAGRLGPHWKLVYTERYEWHYEWRFYLFHTWRTRVWVRVPPATVPASRK